MRKTVLFLIMAAAAYYLSTQSNAVNELLQGVDSQRGVAKMKTLNKVARIYLTTDLMAAKENATAALQLANDLNDPIGQTNAYDILGEVFTRTKNYEQAEQAYLNGLKIRDSLAWAVGQVNSRIKLGALYSLMEKYSFAEECLKKAISTAAENKLAHLQEGSEKGLGELYFSQKNYDKTFDHYGQAIVLNREMGELEEAANISLHLGNISTEINDFERTQVYYLNALNLYREVNNQAKFAETNQIISLSLLTHGFPQKANEYQHVATETFRLLKDTLGLARSLKNEALILQTLGQEEEAELLLQQSADLLQKIAVSPETVLLYEEIVTISAELDDYKNAFQNHFSYSKKAIDYFNKAHTEALSNQKIKHESELTYRENQQRESSMKLERAANMKTVILLALIMVLIWILMVVLFTSHRRKKADRELLEQKNKEIIKQEEKANYKNVELETKNISLDLLNKKLLTEISEREVIERSSFARDRFIATITHEMRNPLNNITALTHLLLKQSPKEEQIEQLRTLQFSANDLIVYINDILDFSKIEAGKLHLQDREFFPAKIVDDVHQRFKRYATESGVDFYFKYDEKIPNNLMGDDARLIQIMTNLLTNTFKHTDEGAVKSVISLKELNTNEALLEIAIEGANGELNGRAVEDMFKPYYAEEGDFEAYDSQQFSLAITKRLVELQNGKIDVEISSGGKAVFTVLLPFKLVLEKRLPSESSFSSSGNFDSAHILVVEDNKINQVVVSKILNRLGVQVSVANNGAEAVEAVNINDFDLILMDIQMPLMDGYRATAEIRRHPNENKSNIPIIALTASAFLTEKEKAVLFGMNDHVGKPFSPDELIEKIKNCLAAFKKV